MIKMITGLVVCLPLISQGAQTLDELKLRHPQLCQDIKKEDGSYGTMACLGQLVGDSQERLKARLKEVRAALGKEDFVSYQKAFERDQKAWQSYKNARCDYLTAGTVKDSAAWTLQGDLCQASENYRRIDTLEGEPPFA